MSAVQLQPLLALLAAALLMRCGTAAAGAGGGSAATKQWMSGREVAVSAEPPPWDPNGYVVAFACQGRFGNQFDYLLGTLDFAEKIDRTLVLVRPSVPLSLCMSLSVSVCLCVRACARACVLHEC